jgi:hypothetical protein
MGCSGTIGRTRRRRGAVDIFLADDPLENCCRARKSAETVAGLTRSRLCRTNVSMSRRACRRGPPAGLEPAPYPLEGITGRALCAPRNSAGLLACVTSFMATVSVSLRLLERRRRLYKNISPPPGQQIQGPLAFG